MKKILLIIVSLIIIETGIHASYNAGLGVNMGTMGKDITIGLTIHNFIQEKWLWNVYGSWDYRFWGYQSWRPTGHEDLWRNG